MFYPNTLKSFVSGSTTLLSPSMASLSFSMSMLLIGSMIFVLTVCDTNVDTTIGIISETLTYTQGCVTSPEVMISTAVIMHTHSTVTQNVSKKMLTSVRFFISLHRFCNRCHALFQSGSLLLPAFVLAYGCERRQFCFRRQKRNPILCREFGHVTAQCLCSQA